MTSPSLHLVDDAGHLVSEEQLSDFLVRILDKDKHEHAAAPQDHDTNSSSSNDKSVLQHVGTHYHVVGVFGGQSSGKSTLLNHLFGTQFDTLDAAVRRGQTTKGAFLARARTLTTHTAAAAPRQRHAHVDAAAYGAEDDKDDDDDDTNAAAAATTTTRTTTAAAAVSSAASTSPLLVVDFEGTDGLEHGDNQSFERQLSLFALSMADTLIINMWAVDVGRFNAANLGLLRTIFEVNLQLFAHAHAHKDDKSSSSGSSSKNSLQNEEDKEKTAAAAAERPTLLVVVRDFVEDNAQPTIATLERSFAAIWDSIARTGRYVDARLDTLFDVRYVMLPHYKLQRPAFDAAVAALRRRFVNARAAPSRCAARDDVNDDAQSPLFRCATTCRGVPLDGLPRYLSSCWSAIQASKDLDIPTQREMLAEHRCGQVRAHELHVFADACAQLARRVDRGDTPVQLRLRLLQRAVDARMAAYAAQTRLYSMQVADTHARALHTALLDAAVALLRRWCVRLAQHSVLPALEARLHAAVDDAVTHALLAAQRVPFVRDNDDDNNARSHNAAAADDDDNAQPHRDAAVACHSAFCMDDVACQRVVREFYALLAAAAAAMLRDVCAQPPSPALYRPHDAALLQAAAAADGRADEGGGVDDDDAHATTVLRTLLVGIVARSVYARLRSRLAAMADTAADVMHRGYERCLTHKDDGTARYFATVTGLEAAVPSAQQAGLVLLGCLLCMRLRLSCRTTHTAAAAAHRSNDADDDTASLAAYVLRYESPCAIVSLDESADNDGGDDAAAAAALAQLRRCVLRFVALDVPPVYPHTAAAAAAATADSTTTADAAAAVQTHHKNGNDDTAVRDKAAHADEGSDVIMPTGDDAVALPAAASASSSLQPAAAAAAAAVSSSPVVLLLMSDAAVRHAYMAYRAQCDYTTQLHLRMLHASRQRLPAWVLPALLVLGWNELLYVLTHPLLLVVLVLACVLLGHAVLSAQWQALLETMPVALAVPLRGAAAWLHMAWHQLLASAAQYMTDPAATRAAHDTNAHAQQQQQHATTVTPPATPTATSTLRQRRQHDVAAPQ